MQLSKNLLSKRDEVGTMSKQILYSVCLFLFLCMHVGVSFATDIAWVMGARPLGMAAFTAVADDGNAVTWNPAGLSLIDRMEFNSVGSKLLSDIYAGSITGVLPIPHYGALGLNVNYLDYGNDISRYDENDKFLGRMTVTDTVVALSYGFFPRSYVKEIGVWIVNAQIPQGLSIGGKAKGIRLDRGKDFSFTGWSGDVGLLYRRYKQHNLLSFGICAQDIPKLFYEEEQTLSYPTIKTGIAANFGSLTVAADADFDIRKPLL